MHLHYTAATKSPVGVGRGYKDPPTAHPPHHPPHLPHLSGLVTDVLIKLSEVIDPSYPSLLLSGAQCGATPPTPNAELHLLFCTRVCVCMCDCDKSSSVVIVSVDLMTFASVFQCVCVCQTHSKMCRGLNRPPPVCVSPLIHLTDSGRNSSLPGCYSGGGGVTTACGAHR